MQQFEFPSFIYFYSVVPETNRQNERQL